MQTASANQEIDHEIESPLTRERLHAIQGGVQDIDVEILRAKESLQRRRGMVEAFQHTAKRLFQEHGPLDKELDGADENEVALIRARKETVTKLTDIVKGLLVENAAEVGNVEMRIQGMKFATDILAKRFDHEVSNYERHKERDDEDGVDELGRTPEDREAMAGGNGGLDPRDSNAKLPIAELKAQKARDEKAAAEAKAAEAKATKGAKVAKKKRNRTK